MLKGTWTTLACRLGVLAGSVVIFSCGQSKDGASGGASSQTGLTQGSGEGDGEGDGTGEGDGDGDAEGDGDGDAEGDGDGDGDGEGETGPGTKFDTLSVPDGGMNCGVGGDDAELTYIWIANSSQGTMTKIHTETMIEEGRYMVRPDGAGSPSRTTVNLSGDVAIAARNGGITKVWANTENCPESNGQNGLQTSSGGNDVLPWAVEECRAWHTPMNYVSHRPMAWAAGTFNEQTCGYEDEKLWTSGSVNWSGSPDVLLVNGDTGQVEETIVVPMQHANGYLYGGAVDGDSNFWGLQNSARIIRVDRDDFTVSSWAIPGGPGYGIAVDAESRVWLCGGGHAQRFDPQDESWVKTPGATSGIGGCMTDGEGILYHSRYSQGVIVAIDTETVLPIKEYAIPAYVHGISVDFAGKVWGVSFAGSQAYRLDPETEEVDTFNGLVGAYTYSDMTGFALDAVGNPNG